MYKLRQLKWKLQHLIRGYGDDDLWCFSCLATEKLRKPFKAFVQYQRKHGVGCPPELFDEKNEKNQCHKWLEILKKIERAFDLDYEEVIESDKYFEKTSKQQVEDIKAVKEGFELFGKYYQSYSMQWCYDFKSECWPTLAFC